jgi:hypothetical protein
MPSRFLKILALAALLGAGRMHEPVHAQECAPEEVAKLLAGDGQANDRFGFSVSIDGDVALVGAWLDDDNGYDSGSAYIYRFDGNSWNEEAKLVASDPSSQFGVSVSIDNDVALVGSFSHSAYVYRFDGDSWNEEAILTAAEGGGAFGSVVSIDGGLALVAASESAYVYRYDGNSWNEEARLTPSDGGEYFGRGVSIRDHLALVGAATDEYGPYSGSAYVFRFDGASWNEEAKLIPTDGAESDLFGGRVSIDDDLALISAVQDDDKGENSGSAYIFRFDGVAWNEEAKLTASDGTTYAGFGYSLALDGSTVLIGAPFDKEFGSVTGSAYLFRENGGAWTQVAQLTASDGETFERFGYGVALRGDTALIGAERDDDRGRDAGSAYVFELNCPGGDAPSLRALGTCPGPMRFKVEGASADGRVAYAYARGEGSVVIPPGKPCAGTVLGLDATVRLAGVERADENGVARLDIHDIPPRACGRIYLQAIDLTTCATTNVVPVP